VLGRPTPVPQDSAHLFGLGVRKSLKVDFDEEFPVLNLPYPLPLCPLADRSSKRCRRVGERPEDRSACRVSFTLLVVVGDQGLG
jgi:hypothetical protein